MYPVTELILSRMESNPEEFEDSMNGRWGSILVKLSDSAPPEEWELIREKLKVIRMNTLHKLAMQELCAPEQVKIDYRTTFATHTISPNLISAASMKAQALDLLSKGYK